MTVSKITPVNNYTGNGSTTTFDFDFLIEDESELLVQYTDSDGVQITLTLDEDYTINEVGNEEGSYITFPIDKSSYGVLTSDEVITLALRLDIEQEKEYTNSSKFLNTTLEWSLDYITRILQIMNRAISRCVKVQEGSSNTADELIEALQEAQVNAQNSASEAAASAANASSSEVAASESAESASETLAELQELYSTATSEIASDLSSALSDISEAQTTALEAVTSAQSTAEETITAGTESIASDLEEALSDIEDAKTTLVNYLISRSYYNFFSVNTGDTTDEGEPAFLSVVTTETTEDDETVTTSVLTTSGEFVVTTAAGVSYTITATLTLDITDYEEGTYNVYINPVDLSLSVLDNTITSGITFPDDAADGDYLLNTAKVPYDLQKINITTDEDTEETTTTITTGLYEVYAGTLVIE